MELELTEEQQLIKASMREFCEKYVTTAAEGIDHDARFPMENMQRLAEQDMLGILYPEEYGGAGADFVTCIVTVEELSRACASTGFAVAVNTCLVGLPLAVFGSEEQKRKYLEPLCRGKIFGAFCAPGLATESMSIAARPADDQYVLNGVGMHVANASVAGFLIVVASTGAGQSGFLVPSGTAGLAVGQEVGKFGLRGVPISEVVLKDCRIPKENILGGEGQGLEIATVALDACRTGIAAVAVGIAQSAMDESIAYSKERVQFDKAICNFQAIQWMLVDMNTETEASRFLTYHAAWNHDRGLPYGRDAAMAKLAASSAAVHQADRAVQIHGGIGYIKGQKVERLYRDAKITQIHAGTPEKMKEAIAAPMLQ